jgi:hypothetical protein
MAWEVTITDPDTGSCETLCLGSDSYYLIPKGTVRLYQAVAWCRDCKKFRCAERLPPIEDLDREIAKCRDGIAQLHGELGKWRSRLGGSKDLLLVELNISEEEFESLELSREWRRDRKSPPRCLRCGSTALVFLPDGEVCDHPSGRGRVFIEITSHLQTFAAEEEYYTSEGLRIRSAPDHP